VELKPPLDSSFHLDDELASSARGEHVTAAVDGGVRLLLPA
jgi:hypothetical protein